MRLPVIKQGSSPVTMLQLHNLGPAFLLQIVSAGSHRAKALTHHLRSVAPETAEHPGSRPDPQPPGPWWDQLGHAAQATLTNTTTTG